MRLLPLVAAAYFMVSGGPYAIEDILGGAGYIRALAILLLLPFFWSLPTTLMIGELASALPAEGGFYVWVRRALGPFWGYQEAWLSLTASIFDMAIYPAFFVLYLGKLFPAWTQGWYGAMWSLGIVVVCCLWNLRGAPAVGDGSVGLFIALLSPFVILVIAGLWHGAHMAGPLFHHDAAGGSDLNTAILVAMWNYMGWDNATTVAQEVENPRKNYPRAMVMSAALVAITYVIPLLAIAAAGISVSQFSTGSWTDAANLLVGKWLGIAIVLGGTMSGLGMFNALMLSYTRLPMVLAEDGMLPRCFAKKNKRGVPWVAIVACGAAWALALRFNFERLISMDLILYGSSLVLEFVALIVLRRKEPNLPRPFRVGNFGVACLVAVAPTGLILFAMYTARTERLAHMPALLFGLLVACTGPCLYWISRKRWGAQPVPELAAEVSTQRNA